MFTCGEGIIATQGERVSRAVEKRCNSWTCPECAPRRQASLKALARGGNPTVFITVTHVRVEGMTPTEALARLVDAWRRFRRHEMKLRRWKRFPFLAIPEDTKLGWPHLHIVARCGWIDQKRLSQFMAEALASPIVDIRKVDNAGRAAAYVAKYMGKAPAKHGNLKRYWRSQDWDQRPPREEWTHLDPDERWSLSHEKLLEWSQRYFLKRWSINVQSRGYIIAEAPW